MKIFAKLKTLSQRMLRATISLATVVLLAGAISAPVHATPPLPYDVEAVTWYQNGLYQSGSQSEPYQLALDLMRNTAIHAVAEPTLFQVGGGGHAAWRDIFSTTMGQFASYGGGMMISRLNSNGSLLSLSTGTGSWVGATNTATQSVMAALRFHAQPVFAGYLIRHKNVPAQKAKWIALVTFATANAFLNAGSDAIAQQIYASYDDNSSIRRLLGLDNIKDFPPGLTGDIFAQLADYPYLWDANRNLVTIPYIPGFNTGSRVFAPPNDTFDGRDVPLDIFFNEYRYNSDGSPAGIFSQTIGFSPAGYHQFPIKYMRDTRGKDWFLSKKEGSGFQLYSRTSNDTTGNAVRAPLGQLMDFYPGPTYIWGVGPTTQIYRCTQPCVEGTHSWSEFGGRARSIAIGPDTNGTNRTWVFGTNGSIYSVLEGASSGTGWTVMAAASVPRRIFDQLYERNPELELSQNWWVIPQW